MCTKMSYFNNILKDRINEHTFLDVFNKNSYIIDLGSNRGNFSKKLIEKYDYKHIVLVEANPEMYKIIENNFSKINNKTILNKAVVGKKTSENITFYIASWDEASSLNQKVVQYFGTKNNEKITVKTTTLNDIIESLDTSIIDLIKIDVEGIESEIIKNITDENLKKTKQLSIEYHDFADPLLREGIYESIKLLKNAGYELIEKNPLNKGYTSQYFDCLFINKRYFKMNKIIE